MKALVLSIVLLTCVDLVGNAGQTLRAIAGGVRGAGHEIGAWVYQP
jgi:hypothetical protein